VQALHRHTWPETTATVAARPQPGQTSAAQRWVAVADSASTLTAAAVRVATASGDTTACWPRYRPSHPTDALTGVLHALGGAAAAWTRTAFSTRAQGRVGPLSGIDYLAQLVCRVACLRPRKRSRGASAGGGRVPSTQGRSAAGDPSS